ncbi:hypothetical protein KY358_05650 [Candidatus Woesearchaeota archaeon]|nr:hypothetical protein [Candidatus Woesearchaeota archaeon]
MATKKRGKKSTARKMPSEESRAKPVRRITLWKWIVISIPLVVGIMWAISILSVYNEIPVVYEQASPSGVNMLLVLIFIFIASYGAFVFMRFRRKPVVLGKAKKIPAKAR